MLHHFRGLEGRPEPQESAVYLLVPQRETGRTERGATEEKARDVVDVLTDLERTAAVSLFGIDTDLDVFDNHLQVYAGVARRSGDLWDALAMHLPKARGRQLARVHAAIDLLHQTPVQGVADLDEIATEVRQSGFAARIRAEADKAEATAARARETYRDLLDAM